MLLKLETNTTTTVEEEEEEAAVLAGKTMTSHSGTEILLSIFGQIGQ